jgi:UDP:flavonoid glycosyltransferase YjiC (YdhE family)
VRVLVATTAGAGHFGPLTPFAGALRDAGHDVVVAAPASFAGSVERAGFAHLPFADADAAAQGAVFGRLPGLSNEEANAIVVHEIFVRINGRAALPGMRAAVEEWRPDLVLRDPSEFASYAVATETGVPHASVAVGLLEFDDVFLPGIAEPLADLGVAAGLAGLLSEPCLSLLPELFDPPAATGSRAVRRFRDPTVTAAVDPLPDWWAGSGDPLVYVSFGSVAAGLGLFPVLYQQVVEGLADVPVRVLLTVGEAGEPETIRPCPANAHVERWWPQQAVMPHASAMIGHGGMGTTMAGLAAGVPMVVLPLFADQPFNARRVHALGAGISVDGGPAGVGAIPEALTQVLGDPSYRQRAGVVRDAMLALSDVAEAVPFLEEVAAR